MKKYLIAGLMFAALLYSGAAICQLSWPSAGAATKPWTRWWWMGSAVDKQNLTVNLERYRAAGLGGLELTPIYGVKGYENKFINYLSPAWMDMFSYTLQETRRLGLGMDMSNGTGWPFGGGPLIDSTYACKEMFSKTWTVSGGSGLADSVQFIQEPLVHTDGFPKPVIGQLRQPIFSNPRLQDLALDQVRFAGRLRLVALMAYAPSTGDVGGGAGATGDVGGHAASDAGVEANAGGGAVEAGTRVLDLTSKVGANGVLHWTAPAGGEWTLYGIFQGAHGKMVERAAPGAEGNVIDHFSAAALTKYLSRFDTAFGGRSLAGLRCMFNDSYEVDDSRGQGNWTGDFFDAFLQHRRYDLRWYLPALLGKDKQDINDRVLCDYRETISDLLLEQFTLPWRCWANAKGLMIRNQAHGSPANILDLYAASDIPETEGTDILRFKFATSAAHVTGKRLVSAEAVTWQKEHFLSNQGDIRGAVDKYLLSGVNHIFYHGTAYSPDEAPWPGWLFYAAVHFTPNDPSWQHFHVLNEYVTRCQGFLQQGISDNDVLLYYPLYDSWSDRGRDLLKHYDRMEPDFNGTDFKKCADSMLRMGYAFDYISDKQLRETDTANIQGGAGSIGAGEGGEPIGIRTAGGARYRTVLLPGNRYISVEAFERLIKLAASGATVIAYGSMPSDVPGLGDSERRRGDLRRMLAGLDFRNTGDPGIRRAVIGKGAFITGGDINRLLWYAGAGRETMVDKGLEVLRRKYADGHVYFIVNQAESRWSGWVTLSVGFRSAAIFDPMTGRKGMAQTDGGRVFLQLEPGESCLVRLYDKEMKGERYVYYDSAGAASGIGGKWTIRFIEGGPLLPGAVEQGGLGSWTKLGPDAARFSGTAAYSIPFARPAVAADCWQLDLGKVNETAAVLLNGRKLATLIGPRYMLVIPGADLLPHNRLEIRVSNGMANRIIDMDKQGLVWKKFYNTNFPAHERENRGADGLFSAAGWEPRVSGLSGPVTLTPLRVIRPAE